MSFIPIIARADIVIGGETVTDTEKKGKITPAQMAQLNAFTLVNKTGILDCLNHCTAKTSSVNSDNISTVTFQSGYIVVCGRLIECENGTTVEINTLSIPNGKIILSIDLVQLQENEVKIQVVDNSYVLQTQNLNENSLTGKYDFELYSYTTSGSNVTLTRTNTNYIPTVNTALTDVETKVNKTILGTGTTGSGSAPLQGYNTNKGTVEERLTALGFREGSIENLPSGTVSLNSITRLGNYCILNLKISLSSSILIYKSGNYQNPSVNYNLPNDFYGKTDKELSCYGYWTGYSSSTGGASQTNGTFIGIIKNGTLTLKDFTTSYVFTNDNYSAFALNIINFGYEANPLS